jgi:gluconate kinase
MYYFYLLIQTSCDIFTGSYVQIRSTENPKCAFIYLQICSETVQKLVFMRHNDFVSTKNLASLVHLFCVYQHI